MSPWPAPTRSRWLSIGWKRRLEVARSSRSRGRARINQLEDFEKKIEARLGPSGFMKFFEVDHGPWMALHGVKVKSKQYVIGNPLIARKIVPHDPAAGFYVPLRVGVYEDKQGKAWVQSTDLRRCSASPTIPVSTRSAAFSTASWLDWPRWRRPGNEATNPNHIIRPEG